MIDDVFTVVKWWRCSGAIRLTCSASRKKTGACTFATGGGGDSDTCHLARNIWLNYKGWRPEFSQNGGYAVGFAEWLRAIDLPTTANVVMLAFCRLNFNMHMLSAYIYLSFFKSCAMLHFSQFSKWPKISPHTKLKSNRNFQIGMTQTV